ncbi:glycosyltransferase family 2 protein [Methylobacterium sp. 174MFSha1.1]|uniref:glycosyltransferase family 2 protein n=1 Tax=Methylobacterium sp. 174MFSha1.1 TaxID=1502749 RepID=UPI001160B8C8|nr:glycosyltransferase family 2 protein [Methylobacterium sp. 174MFSha1.1]
MRLTTQREHDRWLDRLLATRLAQRIRTHLLDRAGSAPEHGHATPWPHRIRDRLSAIVNPPERPPGVATVVAIAKNEGRYITEWIAWNLAIGFDRILIFSNDSTDDTDRIVSRLSRRDPRVALIPWPSVPGTSPQITAYTQSLRIVTTPWVMFLDIDEFLLPFADGHIHDFLDRVPADVASVHINWRNFGSGGRTSADYDFVTKTFFQGADLDWANHHHFKSFIRTALATDVHVHDAGTSEGRRTLSDFKEFTLHYPGIGTRTVHDTIQINHYQCKTYDEFVLRMRWGDANYAGSAPRDHSRERFDVLDRNETSDFKTRLFEAAFDAEYERLTR